MSYLNHKFTIKDDVFIQRKWMFYPGNVFFNFWAILISILLIYECTINPYRLAFNIEDNTFFTLLNEFITIIFFLDIVINFRSVITMSTEKLWTSQDWWRNSTSKHGSSWI
jgi:hypothetical protein